MTSLVDETSSITGHLKDKDNATIADTDNEDEGEIYEVERILKDKVKRGVRLFLVRWKGYGPEEDSWEPEDNLEGASEILNNYLANCDKKKPKTSSSSKKSEKGKKNSFKKKEKSSKVVEEDSDDDKESKGSDTEFEPAKKRGRKSEKSAANSTSNNSKLLRGSTKAAVETPSSNVDRVVARRKNISKNMRWISESSDESAEASDNENAIVNTSAIHPDSSTDPGKLEQSKPSRNGEGNGLDKSSLKMKISKDDDEGKSGSTLKVAILEEKPTEPKESKEAKVSNKKQKRALNGSSDGSALQENPGSKSSLTFTGVYRDTNHELHYVAIDNKTKKQEDYCLAGAFMADGWSLCRYLSSRLKFASDGEVHVDGDIS